MCSAISQPEVLIFEEIQADVKQSPIIQVTFRNFQAKIDQGEIDDNWVFRAM